MVVVVVAAAMVGAAMVYLVEPLFNGIDSGKVSVVDAPYRSVIVLEYALFNEKYFSSRAAKSSSAVFAAPRLDR